MALYSTMQSVLQTLLQPLLQQIQDDTFPHIPSTPLAPATLADMVVRNVRKFDQAAADAQKSGLDTTPFADLVKATGDGLPIEQAMQALRRQFIPQESGDPTAPSFMTAVRQSRLKDEWADTLLKLQWQTFGVADVVEGITKSQLTPDEVAKYAREAGIQDPELTHLVNIAGNPPGPQELLTMYRRGFIGLEGTGPNELTVQQGIYEGRTKNKWWGPLSKMVDYLPPPRTITALERSGSISQDKAVSLYQKQGLPADLVAAYTHSASLQKVAKQRQLTETQVVNMYEAHQLDLDTAKGLLGALNYTAEQAAEILAYADLKRALAALSTATKKIQSLYVARKLSRDEASGELDRLGLPTAQRDNLLADWDVEREVNRKVLTEAQIVSAWGNAIIGDADAELALTSLGYSPWDAWLLLSNHKKAPIGDAPTEGAPTQERAV